MAYLTPKQLQKLEHQLKDRRITLSEEIRNELIRSDNENYIDLAGRVHDEGEASVADLLVDLNIATVDRQVREMHEVEEALQRIKMGSYGICDDCGTEISYERLASHSVAKRCVMCQGHRERTYAGQSRPTL